MIAGRLTQDGDLKVSKSIDTRLPLVTNGLLAHYPFDGSTKGIANLNKIDYSTWTIGTIGTQVGFNINGTAAENSIVEDIGPFGEPQAIWQALGNDTTSNDDGGWNGDLFSVDITKKYRFSVWIRRKVTGNGTAYLGCAANSVYNITANTVNTNPYFWNGSIVGSDWRLYVAYIYPSTMGNVYPTEDAGIYNLQKQKISAITSFKFSPTATNTYLRTYLYYSTDPLTNQQWAYPRVDLCDGTEPSLDDLLSGEGNVINAVVDTNNTNTFDGVAVEEGTTNLIPYGDFSNGLRQPYLSAYNGVLSIVYDNTFGRNVLRHTNSSGAESYFNSTNFPLTPSIAGDTWTNTVYVRSETVGASVEMVIFELNSVNAYVQTSAKTIIVNPWDGWVKLSLTYTFINAATVNIGTRLDLNNKGTVHYRDWQLEQKACATTFTQTSRGTGYLQYSSKYINGAIGTFHFEAYIYPKLHSTTAYIDMLDFITPSANRFLILRKNANNVIPDAMFLRDGATYRTINTIPYIIQNEWNSFTWVWNTTSGYSMYINNNLVASGVTYAISNLPSDFFKFHYSWIIKNLSIYNRVLSADEIKTLTKGTHSITQDALICKSIETKPVIPGDSFYFPLDLNGNDSMENVLPSEITNFTGDSLVDSGAFVGGSSVNLLYTDGAVNLTTGTDVTGHATKYDLGGGYYKFVNDGVSSGVIRLTCNLAYLVNGSVYACSVQYIDRIGAVHLDWSDTAPLTVKSTSSREGILEITASRATYDATYRFLDINMSIGSSITLFNPQVEQKTFRTPFVAGTRGISSLEYNLNASIGLDWNANWSICYFKKPMGTHTSGLNIESLGCNSNSVGGGYIYWGKNSAVNAMYLTSNSSFTPSVYFENWQCITMVKSGSTLTIETWLNDKLQRTRTVTYGTIASNYFVTQYGYDLKLGGWDNSNECWSYFKHLTVLKRAMSTQELSEFRKNKMSATTEVLTIQSSISTHENLI